MGSAMGPVQIALWNAIIGDSQLNDLLAGDRVYSVVAPEDAPMPHIVLRTSAESDFNVFRRKGKAGTEEMTIHSARMDKEEILSIYDRLEVILNGTRLLLDGHTMLTGKLTAVTILPDEHRGVYMPVRYEPLSQEGA